MLLDVFPNPIARQRRAAPYVVVLQSAVADTRRDRIVAFLVPRTELPGASARLMPAVTVAGREMLVLMPSLTNVPASELRAAVGNIAPDRDRLVAALDWLFLGI